MISEYIQNKKILSFLVPHGSYYYSGYVSAFTYYLINTFDCDNFIILSSDHCGTSPGISIMDRGYWTTPLGKVQINEKMANELMKNSNNNFIQVDSFSFDIDHTIEIQLPFIQSIKKNNFQFLPILQKNQDKKTSIELGKLLSGIIPIDQKVILISTSNFTHYLNYKDCYEIDKRLISKILTMSIDSFYTALQNYFQYICGYGCIASMIEFSRIIGNSDAVLLKYLTSGDVDGNRSSVVGYTSMLMM